MWKTGVHSYRLGLITDLRYREIFNYSYYYLKMFTFIQVGSNFHEKRFCTGISWVNYEKFGFDAHFHRKVVRFNHKARFLTKKLVFLIYCGYHLNMFIIHFFTSTVFNRFLDTELDCLIGNWMCYQRFWFLTDYYS